METTIVDDSAEPASSQRVLEMRRLARAIANDEHMEAALRVIAESIRGLTGAIAVAIERHAEGDAPNLALAWAGPHTSSAADVNAEIARAHRFVISLGGREGRLGAVVIWRERAAPRIEPEALECVGDLTNMAALALRRVVLEEQLAYSREDYERLIETKFRLINGTGEELKNRLGAAAEYVQLLDTEGELNAAEQRYISGSRRSIDAAVHLINEMVQLARAETGRLVLTREPVDIGRVLRAIVRDYQLAVGTFDVEFHVSVPENLPIIETDVDQVRQILDNLLGNAVRYTPVGGRITVRADVRPGRRRADPSKYVCLAVSDTGPGVGDKDLIFEEVYRVERRGGMPGFRLAISRRVARLLGGELTLETQPDAGSTFTLWLPGTAPSHPEP